MEHLIVYLPMDRRYALIRGERLPDRTEGATLFADISGFTKLTEALVHELGVQRGAEELTRYLNLVYDAIIDEIHRFSGSVIAFAGDAITCWFDGDSGLCATSAALAMQQAMQQFATLRTPAGTVVSLSMKVAVAAGPVRRFLIGDPNIRLIDTIAGEILVRLAAAEGQAESGEVVLDEATWRALGDAISVTALRQDEETASYYAVVAGIPSPIESRPWPPLDFNQIDEAAVRPWLLAPVYQRLRLGMGHFLAELRPTVALFLRFSGIDYDHDEAAGEKLGAYICWVLNTITRYGGTLIDLNIGDKGSYLYINFGAPQSYEDNAARAASAALALQDPPPDLNFIESVQIGISQGRMRAGAYGGANHRTYGVLGDEVNMAARLMMKAKPGQTVISEAAQRSIARAFDLDPLPPMQVKGKNEPVTAYVLRDVKQFERMHRMSATYALPMVGRAADLAHIEQAVEQAAAGRGQVITLVGEPGVGKSRLVAEAVRFAEGRSIPVYGGACESYSINSSYFVWQPIWRDLLGVDPTLPVAEQIEILACRFPTIDPDLLPRLPLLGAVLQFAIPDNDFTRSFDAKLRKSSLESLLVDVLRRLSHRTPMLIVLEDCHWLDDLSYELLQVIGRAIGDLPICLLLTHRVLSLDRLRSGKVSALPYYSEIRLELFTAEEARLLVQLKLTSLTGGEVAVAESVAHRLVEQAQGNPFYLEELIAYLHFRGISFDSEAVISSIEMPDSLHRLVLSRLDQLSESQQITAKIASIGGRIFRVAWLWGAYPALGTSAQVRSDVEALRRQDLVLHEPDEAELTYFFKQVITQNVIYESLPHELRTTIHGEIGRFVEETYADALDPHIDLLAYHYDRSNNQSKRCEYLRKAGEVAQAKYANQAAVDYYERLMPLLPPNKQIEIMRKLGQVLELMGRWKDAQKQYEQALVLAEQQTDYRAVAWCQTAMGEVLRKQGEYDEAILWLERARKTFEELADIEGLGQALHYTGTLTVQQGNYEKADKLYEESLVLRQQLNDRASIASLLSNRGIIASYQGNYLRSRSLYEQSLTIRQELGDRWAVAATHNNLGMLYLEQDDLAAARAQFETAVNLQQQIGDKWGTANTLHNLANVARNAGNYREAMVLYARSLVVWQELGERWVLAYWLEDTACLAVLEGRYEQALKIYGAASVLREQIGSPLAPAKQKKLDTILAPARQALSEGTQKMLHEAGRHMALEQAIVQALNNMPVEVLTRKP
jgi:adenylate cyclase